MCRIADLTLNTQKTKKATDSTTAALALALLTCYGFHVHAPRSNEGSRHMSKLFKGLMCLEDFSSANACVPPWGKRNATAKSMGYQHFKMRGFTFQATRFLNRTSRTLQMLTFIFHIAQSRSHTSVLHCSTRVVYITEITALKQMKWDGGACV